MCLCFLKWMCFLLLKSLSVGFVIVGKKTKEKASDGLHVNYAELVVVNSEPPRILLMNKIWLGLICYNVIYYVVRLSTHSEIM